MPADRVRSVSLSVAEVTPTTRWIFLEVRTDTGLRGVGEATLSGQEGAVEQAVGALAAVALALPTADATRLQERRLDDLPTAAAFSALDQALWDVAAQRRGSRLADLLGPARRERIPVYANINRRTSDRTPAGFAASAIDALAAGHRAIKLAPFDEARHAPEQLDGIEALAPGLARIAAVRDAIGSGPALMIDCHWRLGQVTADYAIDAAADLGVSWIECPLPELPDQIDAIARLRGVANRRDVTLAGLETAIGVTGFLPFVWAGAYDVMMPDVKYVGGLSEMLRLAAILRGAGIGFSPHNPSGPISHAASLQLCAAVDSLHSLETQFDETPLFAALVGADLQKTQDGTMGVPNGPGLGATLRRDVLRDRRVTHWTTEQHS